MHWLLLCVVVCLCPGGQQSRLPVPTGTHTPGIHYKDVFAGSHLDWHSAYLHPWVIALCILTSLARSLFHKPLLLFVSVYPHYCLLRSLLYTCSQTHNFHPRASPAEANSCHLLHPAVIFDLPADCFLCLNQPIIILRVKCWPWLLSFCLNHLNCRPTPNSGFVVYPTHSAEIRAFGRWEEFQQFKKNSSSVNHFFCQIVYT